MALTYGTKARLPTTAGVTTANPAVFAITCPANTGVLWLRIFVAGTTARAGGAPTYNGVAMTAGYAKTNHGGTAEANGETWYMLNPPTGASYNISVPNTGTSSMALIAATGTKSGASMICARENGVNTPGNSTNPTATTPSLANTCLVFAGVGNGATTWAPTARTGTQLYDWDAGAYGLGAQYRSGSGALAMGWTFATSEDWLVQADAFYEYADTNDELEATGIAAGAPSLGTPSIGQVHALGAAGISVSPVVGTPTLWSGGIDALEASGIASGAPTVGVPTISQVHALLSVAIAAGVPSVGNPTLGQSHALQGPTGFAFGAPVLGVPSMAQIHALTAIGIDFSGALLGNPVMGQLHVLVAQGIATGAPIFELLPTLAEEGGEEEELPGGPGSARAVFIRSHK